MKISANGCICLFKGLFSPFNDLFQRFKMKNISFLIPCADGYLLSAMWSGHNKQHFSFIHPSWNVLGHDPFVRRYTPSKVLKFELFRQISPKISLPTCRLWVALPRNPQFSLGKAILGPEKWRIWWGELRTRWDWKRVVNKRCMHREVCNAQRLTPCRHQRNIWNARNSANITEVEDNLVKILVLIILMNYWKTFSGINHSLQKPWRDCSPNSTKHCRCSPTEYRHRTVILPAADLY